MSHSGHVVLTTQIPTSPPKFPNHNVPVNRLSSVRNKAYSSSTSSSPTRSSRTRSPSRNIVVESHLSHYPSVRHMSEYVHLLESRLEQLDPSVQLPLQPGDIQNRLLDNSEPALQKNVPSHILSNTARFEGRIRKLQDQLNKMERSKEVEVTKAGELRRQNLELRRLCERYV